MSLGSRAPERSCPRFLRNGDVIIFGFDTFEEVLCVNTHRLHGLHLLPILFHAASRMEGASRPHKRKQGSRIDRWTPRSHFRPPRLTTLRRLTTVRRQVAKQSNMDQGVAFQPCDSEAMGLRWRANHDVLVLTIRDGLVRRHQPLWHLAHLRRLCRPVGQPIHRGFHAAAAARFGRGERAAGWHTGGDAPVARLWVLCLFALLHSRGRVQG